MMDLPQISEALMNDLIQVARSAGEAILTIYHSTETAQVQLKEDESPLTAADMAAHRLITLALPKLLDVPMISEESLAPSLDIRKTWSAYWLIDPLDGTKEFIAKNGQFTVNIALVVDGTPLLGIVHVPVSDETYLGVHESIAADGETHADKFRSGHKISHLKTTSVTEKFTAQTPLAVLMSVRHVGEEALALVTKLKARWPGNIEPLSAGSSLKFCWIAEGKADFYPRLAPTCEWDTAAAQAILTAAGGMVIDAKSFLPLRCNQHKTLLNPHFFAMGDANYDWQQLLL